MSLAVTGATGKIGGATLAALLQHDLVQQSDVVVVTSSALDSDKVKSLRQSYPHLKDVRHAGYTDGRDMQRALEGVSTLFLVSTPEIALDFNDAPNGKGREGQHYTVIDAAIAAGVERIVYTSLAFADPSGAGVMRAHFRTEAYLKDKAAQGMLSYVIVREGLYNESWPLYLGHHKIGKDDRTKIVVAGDGAIPWTSIQDLGTATALVIAAAAKKNDRYENRTIVLAQRKTTSLKELASLIKVELSVRSPDEYVAHYRDDGGMDQAFLEWWVSTYPSLAAGHTDLAASSPLEDLLKSIGKTPKSFESTVREMLAG